MCVALVRGKIGETDPETLIMEVSHTWPRKIHSYGKTDPLSYI